MHWILVGVTCLRYSHDSVSPTMCILINQDMIGNTETIDSLICKKKKRGGELSAI